MAGVSRELTLVDKFSSVWDKFIKKADQALRISERQEKQAQRASAFWEKQLDQMVSDYEGPIGQIDRMTQLYEQFARAFGDKSAYTRNALGELSDAIQTLNIDFNDLAQNADTGITDILNKILLLADEGKIVLDEKVRASIEQIIAKTEEAGRKAEEAASRSTGALDNIEKKTSKLGRTLTGLGVMLFGLRKIVQAIKNAMERVPDEIMKPFNSIKSFFSDEMARITSSLFSGMQKGFEKFEAALNSPSVQKVLRGIEWLFEEIGKAIGDVIGYVSELITLVSDFLAPPIYMLINLIQMTWELVKNAIDGITGMISELLLPALDSIGITFEGVIGVIESAFGVVYMVIHNTIANIYNLVATFAEFFANVFNNPVAAIVGLFVNLFNTILNIVRDVASLIDKIVGTDMAGAVAGFQDRMNTWAEELYGDDYIKLERMETVTLDDALNKFAGMGSRAAGALEARAIQSIKASSAETAGNTKAIKDAVTDEDLKMLIDVATQKFVSNVNLTSQTPIITINGANTGNTEADRKRLVNDLKYMLIEQLASGSTSGQYAYAGA